MTRRIPLSHRRALVRRTTRLQALLDVPGVRLHLADELATVWAATERAAGPAAPDRREVPIPFWAFAWAGGIALARYLDEHPDTVAGRTVLDLATGSGLCAIAAARCGATAVEAADIDPYAQAAVELNARANGVHVDVVGRDLLAVDPPAVDVVLAADTWYEPGLAARVLPWLRRAKALGSVVLVGDPGRRYLPATGLATLAAYDVHTTTELEDRAVVRARVFGLAEDASQEP